MIEFCVLGKPETAGSKQAFPFKRPDGRVGVRVVDANKRTKSWQQEVRFAARCNYDGPVLTGAVHLLLMFFVQRPKGHFGTGRNAGKIKASAPRLPTKIPDLLKLSRAIEDALTGVIYQDDSQITSEVLMKRYASDGEPVRCDVKILEDVL
jgi:Holliday junction resolvase RusA-like endonuclease